MIPLKLAINLLTNLIIQTSAKLQAKKSFNTHPSSIRHHYQGLVIIHTASTVISFLPDINPSALIPDHFSFPLAVHTFNSSHRIKILFPAYRPTKSLLEYPPNSSRLACIISPAPTLPVLSTFSSAGRRK